MIAQLNSSCKLAIVYNEDSDHDPIVFEEVDLHTKWTENCVVEE